MLSATLRTLSKPVRATKACRSIVTRVQISANKRDEVKHYEREDIDRKKKMKQKIGNIEEQVEQWKSWYSSEYAAKLHRGVIERELGYKFKDSMDSLRDDGSVDLAILGTSALYLAMLDLNRMRAVKNGTLQKFACSIGLFDKCGHIFGTLPSQFYDNGMTDLLIPHILATQVYPASYYLLKIFGVIFRTDGLDALKEVLENIKFLEHAASYPAKLEEIGVAVYELLLLNSRCLRFKFISHGILATILEKGNREAWHRRMIGKPGVSEFVHHYLRTEFTIHEPSTGDELRSKHDKSHLTYWTFLGTVYRNGGLDLASEMLERHDPERFNLHNLLGASAVPEDYATKKIVLRGLYKRGKPLVGPKGMGKKQEVVLRILYTQNKSLLGGKRKRKLRLREKEKATT